MTASVPGFEEPLLGSLSFGVKKASRSRLLIRFGEIERKNRPTIPIRIWTARCFVLTNRSPRRRFGGRAIGQGVIVRNFVAAAIAAVVWIGAASQVEAYPLLQLDIIGGTYDPTTETIVSDGSSFTLVALLTPKPNTSPAALLAETYYISAAVSPQVGPLGSSLGTYTWNGTTYRVTEDMNYGTPPLEGLHDATTDPGDLSPHGVFPTYFGELPLSFSAANRAVAYNTQDRALAGTPVNLGAPTAGDQVAYYQLITVTTSLADGYQLHFDLYDSYLLEKCKRGACSYDEDIDHFAPFSHDAQSGTRRPPPPQSVPEPGSLLLLSLGLAFGGRVLTRRS